MYSKLCRQAPLVVILIGMLVVVTGCIPKDPVARAVDVFDRAERDLADEPEKWRLIIGQVAKDLPDEVQSTLRNEVDDLVRRSIAETGVEFKCASDFYANRAIQGLQRLEAVLKKEPVPTIEPSLCKVIKPSLDLNLSLDDRKTIEVYGYDMDHADQNGQLVRVSLVSEETGNSYPLPERYIGRTTHYQFVLNVGDSEVVRLIAQNKINKIRFLWESMNFPYEVLVIQKQRQTNTVPVSMGSLSHMPVQTGQDADFEVEDDKPLRFRVRAESRWIGNAIQVRVYMYGRETNGGTEVDSWSEWKNAYTVENGWVIVSYAPKAASEVSGQHGVKDKEKWTETLPAGELVQRFEIYGDRKGDEAGTYTRVEAFFNVIQVTIMKVDPSDGMDWHTTRRSPGTPGLGILGVPLSSFDLVNLPDPNLCLIACQQNPECKAWNYTGGPIAKCDLWRKAWNPIDSTCCISGIR